MGMGAGPACHNGKMRTDTLETGVTGDQHPVWATKDLRGGGGKGAATMCYGTQPAWMDLKRMRKGRRPKEGRDPGTAV